MAKVINFDAAKFKQAEERLHWATVMFNEATGDAIDPAIEEYNAALAEYEKYITKK